MDDAQKLIEEGRSARNAGDLLVAVDRYQAAADLLRPLNQPLRLAHTIRHVADIESHLSRLDQAAIHYAEALALYRANPETGELDLANTLRAYALLSESIGDAELARELWTEGRALYLAVNVRAGVEEADTRLAAIHKS